MNLSELLRKGGVYHNISGSTQKEAITNFTGVLPPLKTVTLQDLQKAILERETLMSTSMGRGVAVPHPRNPIIESIDEQYVSIAFLKEPVDWNALDSNPVDTLILIVSANAKMHLEILSKITYFCRDEGFKNLLDKKSSADILIKYITITEAQWKTGR